MRAKVTQPPSQLGDSNNRKITVKQDKPMAAHLLDLQVRAKVRQPPVDLTSYTSSDPDQSMPVRSMAAHLLELELRERLPGQVGIAALRRPSGNGDSQAAWDALAHDHAKLPGIDLAKRQRSRLALTAPTVPMGDSSVMPLLG